MSNETEGLDFSFFPFFVPLAYCVGVVRFAREQRPTAESRVQFFKVVNMEFL